jgi:spore germination protein (amino acid permease)
MLHEEGHINSLQGTLLVFALLTSNLFMQIPTFLLNVSGPAAWQTAIVLTCVALLLYLPTAALTNRFPGHSFSRISEEVAGPFLGGLLTFLVSAWLFATLAVGLRNFTETFIGTILPDTPPSVLMGVALLCVVYASYRGLEPLSRAAQVFLPIIALGVLVILMFSLPRVEASRLYPFWGYGIISTLQGGAYFTGLMAEASVLLALGYAFRDSRTLRRSIRNGVLLSGIVTALIMAVLVTVFGAPDAAHQPFPLYNLARLIYLGRFLQRTESMLVLFWFFSMVIRLAVLFHATTATLAGVLNLPYYRPLVFPVAVLTASVALVPEDVLVVLRLTRDWINPLGIGVMLLPAVLLALALMRGKGGQSHAA